MSSLSILPLIVAGIIAAMTTAVSLRALKMCPILNNPVISLCVGGLTFIGLISLPSGWVGGLLIPYAALGLALVLLLLIGPFLKGKEDRRNKSEWQGRDHLRRDENEQAPCKKEMRLWGSLPGKNEGTRDEDIRRIMKPIMKGRIK